MNTTTRVKEIERTLTKHAFWFLPALLAVLLPGLKVWGWSFLGLEPMTPHVHVRAIIGLAFIGACSGWTLALLWHWTLLHGGDRLASWRVGVLLALALVVGLEGVTRHAAVVDALWGAVQMRSNRDSDLFIREAAMFRRAALTSALPRGKPRLLVVGTSQLIMSVDNRLLQELVPDMSIERRCLPSMHPARMLMASPLLEAGTNDTILVYWSEFDMGGVTNFGTAWCRPVANAEGLQDVLGIFPTECPVKEWRGVLDVWIATQSELWRSRDATRLLLYRAAGTPPEFTKRENQTAMQISGYASGLEDDVFFSVGLESSVRLLRAWKAAGARVIVLEGSVNPVMFQRDTAARRAQMRGVLDQACRELGFLFTPAEKQCFIPKPGDWRDGTHLNTSARARFTECIAEMVRDANTADR